MSQYRLFLWGGVMWQCDTDPTIGTNETRLMETVEPLWKTYALKDAKRFPNHWRIQNRCHQWIKSALQTSSSWWQVAPLFTFPMSVYNLRNLFLLCNRLLKNNTAQWIPHKFAVQHAPTLFVLSCGNENWGAAKKYLEYIPQCSTRGKILNALCEMDGHSPQLNAIVENLLEQYPDTNVPYTVLNHCLKKHSIVALSVSRHLQISTFDWRASLQTICEQWSEQERHRHLPMFLQIVEQQCKKYGDEYLLRALHDELVNFKYHHQTLTSGWRDVLMSLGPCWTSMRQRYLSSVVYGRGNNPCSMVFALNTNDHPVVVEAVLCFMLPLHTPTQLFSNLCQKKLLNAANKLLEMTHIEDTDISYSQNFENHPNLQSWFLKKTIASAIPLTNHRRTKKL